MSGDTMYGYDEHGNLVEIPLSGNSGGYVGEFKYFGFETVPEHCLACDGSEVSRETYNELFTVFGETFGAGDGATTFNLPDLRGAFLRCIGGNAGALGAEQGDAIRDIRGHVTVFGSWGRLTGVICCIAPQVGESQNNCFSTGNTGTNAAANLQSTGQSVTDYGLFFRASDVVPTAEENRPVNVAVNICVVYE